MTVITLPVRIEFELTRDDYAALTFARAPSAGVMRRRILALLALATAALGLMALLTLLTGDLAWVDDAPLMRPLLYLTAGVLAAFVAVSLSLVGLRAWVRRLPRDDGATLGAHQLELGEEGFVVEGRAGRSFVRWSAIVELRETSEHVFLFVDRMLAYVVPKRAFAADPDCRAFVELVQAKLGRRDLRAAEPRG